MNNPKLVLEKRQLRKWMRLMRSQLPEREKLEMEREFQKRFFELPEITGAKMVYCYVSYGTEADTIGLIRELLARGIRVAVPRVEEHEMVFYRIDGFHQMERGYLGILEPRKLCDKADDARAPVLTPGLAFTEDGLRIGYGGGFYDRFFSREPDHLRIALAYPFQMVGTIPTTQYDKPVHRIITPDRVIKTGGKA